MHALRALCTARFARNGACIGVGLALAGSFACSSGDVGAPSQGSDLYRTQACATCHGSEGQGSMLGPALKGAGVHWTREKLVDYLSDPQTYTSMDPRLAQQGKTYLQPMPAYKTLKPEERAGLADFVLSLH
jgi:mono/diheme cytochrome c family protein